MVGFIIRIKMKFSQKKVGDNVRQSTIKLQVWPFKDALSIKIFLVYNCRVYLGRIPAYMISDVDLIKQITVKEFSKFPNRPLSVST